MDIGRRFQLEVRQRPSETNAPPPHHTSSAGAIVAIVVVIVLLIVVAVGVFYGYRFWRARRLGLPPPSLNPFASQNAVSTRNYPARGGVVGWIQGKFKSLRNRRTAGGAYESGRGARTRGFGPLDQDEGAWDARMHDEDDGAGYGGGRGYYEEQELGLTSHHTRGVSDASYLGGTEYSQDAGYHAPRGLEPERPVSSDGRGHSRGLSEFDTGRKSAHIDPFSDAAERSDMGNRGASSRPTVETQLSSKGSRGSKTSKDETSPTERRSIFHEEM